MKITDQVPLATGHFHLEVFEHGQLIEIVDEPNLIVGPSRVILAELLSGNMIFGPVTKFGVGTNGSAPAFGDSNLVDQYLNSVVAATATFDGVASFLFGLSTGEANGMAIMEFGLATGGGMLFARKVRPVALNKTSSIHLSGTWSITFRA